LSIIENKFRDNVIITSADKFMNWARLSSLWPITFGIACCAIEMMATAASRYDQDRLGLIPRPSPRQSDLMIVAGTVTFKMASRIKRLYEQMADPKYVIAIDSRLILSWSLINPSSNDSGLGGQPGT